MVKYYGAHATNLKNNRLKLQVFTELVDGVALEEILASKEPFIPRVVAHYARQIALGLSYMHCHGVAHGDLKVGEHTCLTAMAELRARPPPTRARCQRDICTPNAHPTTRRVHASLCSLTM